MTRSEELFAKAKEVMPGGVNSPVRAFGSVGLTPRFIVSGDGAYLTDADGEKYLDYVGSWGPMILGHNEKNVLESVLSACPKGLSFGAATEAEVEMASFICDHIPSIGMIRMVNSGTEAVMSAIRAARGYTRRDKIVKFEGCYHGHSDALLIKAGSGVMTAGQPGSAGVPEGCVKDTLSAVYNNLDSVSELFRQNPGQIAAVIVEPAAANMGFVPPAEGFLAGLRRICTENEALLIFDEVITGFRLGFTGAQGMYGVTPDLTTFGKIIGAGMPVGAYGGRKEIMQMVAPLGPVYQAGTLSGNPIAMAAGLTQLRFLYTHPEIYHDLEEKGERFFGGIEKILLDTKAPCTCTHQGSLGCLFFTHDPVTDYDSAKKADTQAFAKYFRYMLGHHMYFAPSQFESIFLSEAHTDEDIDRTLALIRHFFERR